MPNEKLRKQVLPARELAGPYCRRDPMGAVLTALATVVLAFAAVAATSNFVKWAGSLWGRSAPMYSGGQPAACPVGWHLEVPASPSLPPACEPPEQSGVLTVGQTGGITTDTVTITGAQ